MIDEIVRYLWRNGWVPQSVERVLPNLPRWERLLRSLGVTEIPRRGQPWSAGRSWAENHLNLLMRQASVERDPAIEHKLRNLTQIRPYKT